jgi:hypothetical protein
MTIGTKNENNIAIILQVAQHNPYTARVLYVEQRVKFNVKRKTFLHKFFRKQSSGVIKIGNLFQQLEPLFFLNKKIWDLLTSSFFEIVIVSSSLTL